MQKPLKNPTPATAPVDTQGARTSGQAPASPTDVGTATPGTPDGMGRAYETDASGSANAHGKLSASAAGGDPINSPVIGNPGEARPDQGYDYGLATANRGQGNPRAVVQPVAPVPVVVQVPPPAPVDTTEYAYRVRARQKGHYAGLREVGDVFDNDLNLPTYPQDPASWFEDADAPPVEDAPRRRRAK